MIESLSLQVKPYKRYSICRFFNAIIIIIVDHLVFYKVMYLTTILSGWLPVYRWEHTTKIIGGIVLALPCNKYCITVYPSYTFINCHTYVSTLRFVLINMILKKKPKLHQKNLNEIQIILCSVCIIRVQNWPSFKHRFKTFDKYLTAVSYIAVFWVFFIPLALRIG